MNAIPEMPIFKSVDPKGQGKMGWAFYYRGTLLWSPIKAQAEGARARLRAKMESELVEDKYEVALSDPLHDQELEERDCNP